MIASLLVQHGVTDAVVSPGTRNAPLLVALDAHPDIESRMVVDERSAAFIALGMSVARGHRPVAIACTSGTAPLNYAPAVAEAFYRHCPLIVITADRPAQWIDQDDSQTIRQPGIYANFIKGTFDIATETDNPDDLWHANRLINDAINLATTEPAGPVHINVQLDDPLGAVEEIDGLDLYGDDTRVVERFAPEVPAIPPSPVSLQEFADRLAPPAKVLVLCGFMKPWGIDHLLGDLSRRPNIVVMHEAQSNLHGYGSFIGGIDSTLLTTSAQEREDFAPDIVITLGGSVTSRLVKSWLRKLPNLKHWSIGAHHIAPDTFRHLTVDIPFNPWGVLSALIPLIPKRKNSETTAFKEFWLEKCAEGLKATKEFAATAPWSDFKAMSMVMASMPHGWNLHLSNGTAIRYAQLFDYSDASTIECNRGVSGIDGCTSTAIGSAVVNENPTVLISGDMCMLYDMGALACNFIPPTFKIIVLNNGGGGIFRFIKTTRSLDALERNFAGPIKLPLAKLATAFGFKYYSADNETSLAKALKRLVSTSCAPAILEIFTDGNVSAEVLTSFYSHKLISKS